MRETATGDALELYQRGRKIVFALPTNDRLFAVFVGWTIDQLDAIRRDPEGELLDAVDEVPELAERVRGGRREERMLGATQLPNFLRRPGGPGWVLMGDAGCHKDPDSALGVCDAFRDAELVAEAISDVVSGRRDEAEALAHYERLRNEATLVDYRANVEQARLGPPPPEVLALRASVRGSQEATNTAMLVGEGRLAPEAELAS